MSESKEVESMHIMAAQRAIGELKGILGSTWDDEKYVRIKPLLEESIKLIKEALE